MISDIVFKRSILNNITHNNSIAGKRERSPGAASIVGMKSSSLFMEGAGGEKAQEEAVMSVKSGCDAVIDACNELASRGVVPCAVNVSIILPADYDEEELKHLIAKLDNQCAVAGTCIGSIDAAATAEVLTAQLTACAVGAAGNEAQSCHEIGVIKRSGGREDELAGSGYAKNYGKNLDIIMTGFAGQSGMRRIIQKYREDIEKVYDRAFVDSAYAGDEELFIYRQAKLAGEAGAECMCPAGEGGIFEALWRLSDRLNCGIDIDFRKIPVKQEIIEICELLRVNPYELSSLGCLLVTSSNGCGIVNLLKNNGCQASVIGCTTSDKARIIRLDGEIRYLDAPRNEESERMLGNALE